MYFLLFFLIFSITLLCIKNHSTKLTVISMFILKYTKGGQGTNIKNPELGGCLHKMRNILLRFCLTNFNDN